MFKIAKRIKCSLILFLLSISMDFSQFYLRLFEFVCLCSQIMGAFNVMPNDQHLKTSDGIHLIDNEATLGDLAILPGSLILATVSKKILINH